MGTFYPLTSHWNKICNKSSIILTNGYSMPHFEISVVPKGKPDCDEPFSGDGQKMKVGNAGADHNDTIDEQTAVELVGKTIQGEDEEGNTNTREKIGCG